MDDGQLSKGKYRKLRSAILGLSVVGLVAVGIGTVKLGRIEAQQRDLRGLFEQHTQQVVTLSDSMQADQRAVRAEVESWGREDGQLRDQLQGLVAGQARIMEAAAAGEQAVRALADLSRDRDTLARSLTEVADRSDGLSEQLTMVVARLQSLRDLSESNHAQTQERLLSLTTDRGDWAERLARIESMQDQVSQATQRNGQLLAALAAGQTGASEAMASFRRTTEAGLDLVNASQKAQQASLGDQGERLVNLSGLVSAFEGHLETGFDSLQERQAALALILDEVRGVTEAFPENLQEMRVLQDAALASAETSDAQVRDRLAGLRAETQGLTSQVGKVERNQEALYQTLRRQGDRIAKDMAGLAASQGAFDERFGGVDADVTLVHNDMVVLRTAFTGLKHLLDASIEGLNNRVDANLKETLALSQRLEMPDAGVESASRRSERGLPLVPDGDEHPYYDISDWTPIPPQEDSTPKAGTLSTAEAVSRLVP